MSKIKHLNIIKMIMIGMKCEPHLAMVICFKHISYRSTVDEKEQKRLLMDLEVVMKSNDCPFIVQFYGAIFKVKRN